MSTSPQVSSPDTDARRDWTHIVRNTALVAASFGVAAVAGLVRNIIIGQQFGLGQELDAYYAAFKLPDLLFTIVAGGALATAFIPVFTDVLANEGRSAAWRLAAAITNLVLLVVSVVALLTALVAPWLVSTLIAPGFDAAQQAETAGLMRIVLLSTLLFSISSVQSGVLHGFKHFLLPALAPAIYPIGIIAGALWLSPSLGVAGLAWGAVLGSVLHLAIKIPALLYYGFEWRPVFDIDRATVRQVLLLMGPRVLDLGVFHLTLVATTNLASRLEVGSVSALEWGWDAMQLPETIIGTAFGLVAFPTLADLAARNNLAGLRQTLSRSLQAVLAFAIPAACGLILVGDLMLRMLYQRGAFDAAATEAVFVALRFYSLGLAGHVCLELLARAFFAQQDTITPLWVATLFGLANIGLGLLLMGPLGHGGLALANSIAITGEVLLLLWLLRRRWGSVDGRRLAVALLRILLSTGVMALSLMVILGVSERLGWGTILSLFSAVAVGGTVYLVTAVWLRVEAIRTLPQTVMGRFGSDA